MKSAYKQLARQISLVENDLKGSEELLLQLPVSDTPVIGITGPPGAGKSTLVNQFIQQAIQQDLQVACLLVDPSSPFNLGSVLGDRFRMPALFTDKRVFIRSIATRGSLGGLFNKVLEVTELLRSSGFDLIIVETVGVGQSEVEIAGIADCTVLVIVPESGDQIQMLKAGVAEIADIFVINKADRPGAEQLENNLQKTMIINGLSKPILRTVAAEGRGVNELFLAVKALLNQEGNRSKKRVEFLRMKLNQLVTQQLVDQSKLDLLINEATVSADLSGKNLFQVARTIANKLR